MEHVTDLSVIESRQLIVTTTPERHASLSVFHEKPNGICGPSTDGTGCSMLSLTGALSSTFSEQRNWSSSKSSAAFSRPTTWAQLSSTPSTKGTTYKMSFSSSKRNPA